MFHIKVFKSHHQPFLIVYFKTTKRKKSLYPDFKEERYVFMSVCLAGMLLLLLIVCVARVMA